jgi:predicted nuclease of predicted toxin-antitoxin system
MPCERTHDVLYIKEAARGVDDQMVLQLSVKEQRILLTEDKDFGELVVRLALPSYGVVLLRLDPADSLAKTLRLREVIQAEGHRLAGFMVIVDADKVRFRSLITPAP